MATARSDVSERWAAHLSGLRAQLAWREVVAARQERDPETGQFTSGGGTATAERPSVSSVEFDFGVAREEQDGSLTVAERESIGWYSAAGYKELNEALRDGIVLPPELQERQDALDSAFEKAATTLSEPATVYRGMPPAELEVGDVLEDAAFISTSPDVNIAVGFALEPAARIVEITLPPGTSVLIASVAESEVLLPRDAEFIVEQVGGGENPKLTYVPPADRETVRTGFESHLYRLEVVLRQERDPETGEFTSSNKAEDGSPSTKDVAAGQVKFASSDEARRFISDLANTDRPPMFDKGYGGDQFDPPRPREPFTTSGFALMTPETATEVARGVAFVEEKMPGVLERLESIKVSADLEPGVFAVCDGREILLNAAYFGDALDRPDWPAEFDLEARLAEGVESGFHPEGGVPGIVVHEAAHAAMNMLGERGYGALPDAETLNEIRDAAGYERPDRVYTSAEDGSVYTGVDLDFAASAERVSGYARTNEQEFIAEAMQAWVMGDHNPVTVAVGKEVLQNLKEEWEQEQQYLDYRKEGGDLPYATLMEMGY